MRQSQSGVGDQVPKGARLAPGSDERADLRRALVERYEAGETIRELCAATGRGYGSVWRLLVEGGARMRHRGGPFA